MNDVLHRDELPISIDLVAELISSQFPQYADMPILPLGATGSTNRLFRLGEELLVRLPRQPNGGAGIHKERRWLPELRAHLPVEIPEIIGVGDPQAGYPEPWSITRWLDGEMPIVWQPGAPENPQRAKLAIELGGFIQALQKIDVPRAALTDESLRWYRGRPLGEYDRTFRRTLEFCRSLDDLSLNLDAAEEVWANAVALPEPRSVDAEFWYHSDLVAENLLLRDGKLVAVLDFGGLAIGDPTIDLHGAWELFDPPARQVFREALAIDEHSWLRGRAWALAIALGALAYYWDTMPGRRRDRLAMAEAVLADAAGH